MSRKRGSDSISGSDDQGGSLAMQPANPFFDNIRQNLELSHDGISERIPLILPRDLVARADELPGWLRELVVLPADETAERLAHEFYQVEVKEQKRLQAIMNWHSRAPLDQNPTGGFVSPGKVLPKALQVFGSDASSIRPGAAEKDDYFPFSIAAGVERGAKNRQVLSP